MTTAVKNVLRLAEQERRLANEVLRQRGIDNPTLEQLEAACEVAGATIGGDTDRAAEITVGGYGYSREELRRTSIAATQERDRKAGNAHGLGTVDGVEYDVDADSAALDTKTLLSCSAATARAPGASRSTSPPPCGPRRSSASTPAAGGPSRKLRPQIGRLRDEPGTRRSSRYLPRRRGPKARSALPPGAVELFPRSLSFPDRGNLDRQNARPRWRKAFDPRPGGERLERRVHRVATPCLGRE